MTDADLPNIATLETAGTRGPAGWIDRVGLPAHSACALSARGEIDVSTVPQLRAIVCRLLDQGRRYVLVDLEDATFIDGAGIGALITAATQVALDGGTLPVIDDPRLVQLLKLTGETRRAT